MWGGGGSSRSSRDRDIESALQLVAVIMPIRVCECVSAGGGRGEEGGGRYRFFSSIASVPFLRPFRSLYCCEEREER